MSTPSTVVYNTLSPSARSMLEELEQDLTRGNYDKPKQLLRSLPTPMLSDVQAIYEETKQRSEILAAAVFQRTAEVDENLQMVGERRLEIVRSREALERDVQAGFERLRRSLDDRESYLMTVCKDFEAQKERQLAENEAELLRRREKVMDGYIDAQATLEIEDKFNFISGAAEFEQRMDYYLQLDLTVPPANLSNDGPPWFDEALAAIGVIDFAEGSADAAREIRELAPPPRSSPPRTKPPMPAATPPARAVRTPPVKAAPAATESVRSPDSSNAIYINGLSPDTSEGDIRDVFSQFGEIKMVNARHVASGGFAFVFFDNERGAAAALVDPRVPVKERVTNVLAKQQILSGGGRWL